MHFVICRDNGAQFHLRLVGGDGVKRAACLASFGSAEAARRATRVNAGSAEGTEASG